MVAESHQSPRPGIEVVVLARRQLEPVDQLFHVQEVVALAEPALLDASSRRYSSAAAAPSFTARTPATPELALAE